MPTLSDMAVVRTIRIKGETDGVDTATAALDKLKASLRSANDNLLQANNSAKANSDGWRVTGEGAISAANHLRQAAEAAYVFSPAFREVTNGLAAPALRGAASALEIVAESIVTATNVAGTGVIRLGTAVETTFPALALLGVNLKAAGSWMEAFSPTLAGVGTTILSRLLPALGLLSKGLLIVDAIRLVGEAWHLGSERLAEYVAIAEKARDANVSTDFFQRITKGAAEAKRPIDELTEAFKKLNDAVRPTLGGTSAQNRLDELVKLGNFKGNTGVGELQNANSNEEQIKALRDLYDQALQKGERLAGLDIVRAFGGEKLAGDLAKSSDALDKMLVSAATISADELVSAGDIQRAVELQERLDAAEKILSQRWHPIQEILAELGIRMRETWVDILEVVGKVVDTVVTLAQKILEAIAPLLGLIQKAFDLLGRAAPYLAAVPVVGVPLAASAYGASRLYGSGTSVDADQAQQRAQQLDEQRRTQAEFWRTHDTSHAPPKAAEASAYDRAVASINKYIEVTTAESLTVGQSVAQQEKAKVEAQLVAAAMKDRLSREAATAKAQMSGLGDAAAVAAQMLEKAKIAADIKFNRSTALLSSEDVQIATALKSLYPDVATALGSVEAAAIRANGKLKPMNDNRPQQDQKQGESNERDQRSSTAQIRASDHGYGGLRSIRRLAFGRS